MSAQFIRKASLLIGEGSKVLDLSNMQFTFQVTAAAPYSGTPKAAYVRVYNLSGATALGVATEGVQLVLSAGYGGNFASIFQGQITQARIGRENGTDTYLDITAADGDPTYNQGFVNMSVVAGSDVIGRIGQIAKAVNIPLGTIQAPANGAKLARGAVYFGLARDHLRREASSIGANWSINNGELDVINQGGYKAGDIPVITSATGMIGVPEQTEIGVSVRCLLNPALAQNMRVKLDNASIRQFQFGTNLHEGLDPSKVPSLAADGIYKVLYVNHTGDTRGQEWYSDFVAYSGLSPDKSAGGQQLSYGPSIS